MNMRARGSFEVALAPQKPDNGPAENAKLGRMSISKTFHGDLEATSHGEMLAVQGDIKGSAGYVALERVTGTLHGKNGTFVLQHNGTMNRGVPALSVTVVPDSATGELLGLAGKMEITIDGGKHSYDLQYMLLS
jgi:hypothetical protein